MSDAVTKTFPCIGCGFGLPEKGKLCAVCLDKQNSKGPTPMWQLAPQPAPPTSPLRDGHVPIVEDDEEIDGEDGG